MHLQNTPEGGTSGWRLLMSSRVLVSVLGADNGEASTAFAKYKSFSGYTRAGVKAKGSATKHNCWINRAYYNIY